MEELAPLTVAIPFGVAALLVASVPWRRTPSDVLAVSAASATLVLCLLLVLDANESDGPLTSYLGGVEPRADDVVLGIAMAIDPLGAALATLAAVLIVVAALFTWRYFEEPGPVFPALMLVFLGGLVGFSLSGDLFNMFVFFEVMSVSAYALTAYRIDRPGPLQGGLSFAVVNTIGAIMILFGIALLYGRTGALNLAQVGDALAGEPVDGLVVVSFALLVGGFLVKAAAVPFHFWLADAYAVAPTPAAIVFTGVMSDLGIYAIARIYWTVFEGPLAPHAEEVRAVLITFAIVTALLGAVMCLVQEHLKRLLAFATISQIGLALIGVALLTPAGVAGAALLVPADGLLRAGLFVCLGILIHRCGSVHELSLHGRGHEVPRIVMFLFVAGALGLAALPPLGAFTGKAVVEEAAADVGYGGVIAVFFVATLLTSAALLRAAGRIFAGWGDTEEIEDEVEESEVPGARGYTPVVMIASAAILIVAGLAFSAIPGILDQVNEAAARFTDRPVYAATVLENPVPEGREVESVHVGPRAVAVGFVTTLGAIAVAAALLRFGKLPFLLTLDSGNVAERALVRLRRLHSGQIGDYVAWAILGFALLGGGMAVAT
ncbi:MAG TPA: proton-conducting transporter membrane subunit [Solirubrobacterales bacterium]|nr:proton-conducting transporter membrane subunit [Solirubrobacterales bacterium]